jgi:hypothetical protein
MPYRTIAEPDQALKEETLEIENLCYKLLQHRVCCDAASPDRSRRQTHMHEKRHRAQAHAPINSRKKGFQVLKGRLFYSCIFRTFFMGHHYTSCAPFMHHQHNRCLPHSSDPFHGADPFTKPSNFLLTSKLFPLHSYPLSTSSKPLLYL